MITYDKTLAVLAGGTLLGFMLAHWLTMLVN